MAGLSCSAPAPTQLRAQLGLRPARAPGQNKNTHTKQLTHFDTKSLKPAASQEPRAGACGAGFCSSWGPAGCSSRASGAALPATEPRVKAAEACAGDSWKVSTGHMVQCGPLGALWGSAGAAGAGSRQRKARAVGGARLGAASEVGQKPRLLLLHCPRALLPTLPLPLPSRRGLPTTPAANLRRSKSAGRTMATGLRREGCPLG